MRDRSVTPSGWSRQDCSKFRSRFTVAPRALSCSQTDRSSRSRGRRSLEPCAIMRRGIIDCRTDRHDQIRIDRLVAAVVVPLAEFDVDGLGNAGLLIEIAQIPGEIGVVDDAADVALEVPVIDGI